MHPSLPPVEGGAWLLTGMGCLSKSSLKSLRQRNNLTGFIYLGFHLGALAISGFLVHAAMGSWWIIPAMLLYSSIFALLFAPLHECSHFTAFRWRWLNYMVGMFVAFLTMRPFIYFKWRHAEHHTYTQHPSRDPEAAPLPRSFRQYILLLLGANFWSKMLGTLWRGCTGRFSQAERGYIPHGELAKVSLEVRVMVTLYAAITLGAKAVFIGRAFLYGVMAGGKYGVQKVAEILKRDLINTMALTGAASIAEGQKFGARIRSN